MLQAEESIAITQKGNAYLIENITDPDSSELNEDELRLIKKIGKKRKDADTKEIVDFTHSQLPWRMTDKMDEVPYAFISQEYYDHVY
ncbi:MAG: DUF4065 domain-containing protein [Candidatus Peribacteria bacterium]|jgi:hypothetical protein|nr:DUF4065 domain-containing protein [Candidatus Peribacteria bacterium]